MTPHREGSRDAVTWGRGHGSSWRRHTHVALRCALLVAGCLAWGALAYLLVWNQPSSGPTVYQTNPRPVAIILAGLVGALLVETGTLAWRVARHSTRTGVAGMTVAALAAAVAFAGMLTVGLFIVPIAVVLVLVALPLPPEDPAPPWPIGGPRPGWYEDPGARGALRYWDGSGWTAWVVPTRHRGHAP